VRFFSNRAKFASPAGRFYEKAQQEYQSDTAAPDPKPPYVRSAPVGISPAPVHRRDMYLRKRRSQDMLPRR
jgi:hypothetical protein